MKELVCTIAGVVGGFLSSLFGGWDSALITLLIFMGIDFATGVITAAMGRSKHSKNGGLSSKAGWFGIAKKVCTLLLIVVAVRIDILIGTKFYKENHLTKRKMKNDDVLPKYFVENDHEPIIDRETFEKAQELLKEKIAFAPKSPALPSPFLTYAYLRWVRKELQTKDHSRSCRLDVFNF